MTNAASNLWHQLNNDLKKTFIQIEQTELIKLNYIRGKSYLPGRVSAGKTQLNNNINSKQ